MQMNHFFTAGINYKKSDASIRGEFAIGPDQYASLLKKARGTGVKEMFVLSTCNRTEIYGVADDVNQLIHLLCSETVGDAATFHQLCYIKQGGAAVQHIFEVGAGLDSQILGDYEIVGQMKLAVKFARDHDFVGAFLERIFNTVLQASKAIKNETSLSGGTISVSFAAIQFLKEQLKETHDTKIALVGTGKIGRNTCKNLVDYLGTKHITLLNRTDEKAAELAKEMQLQYAPYALRKEAVDAADVVIVATNAEKAVITRADLLHSSAKILIDLSIPNNIEPAAGTLPQITLANVDDLSLINDLTLQKRKAEVPMAQNIITKHREEFMEWFRLRSHVPVLKAVKQKLQEMHSCNMYLATAATSVIDQMAIQKVVNNVAVKMRSQHQPGCYYIEAINDFMTSN